jgi:hypothetical protein
MGKGFVGVSLDGSMAGAERAHAVAGVRRTPTPAGRRRCAVVVGYRSGRLGFAPATQRR